MGITVDDIYRIEYKFISNALELEDLKDSLHTVKTLEVIRGAHIMASYVIARIEKEKDT